MRPLSEELARNFIGGYGIGAKILYDEMPAHTDVFAPESMLGFMSGPMSASRAFFGGRYMVVSKSPVTGMWNDANSGGYFGAQLRHSGFDGVFVKGISEKPVYLYLNNGESGNPLRLPSVGQAHYGSGSHPSGRGGQRT